jgi:nitroimidazol reductase NimA-like FMN-containing flavoprotein (pyridoxamine 5'-phosphate oxidase superfamily)
MPDLITEPRYSETTLDDPKAWPVVDKIMHGQRSGVLGTSHMDIPLCSQMAFAVAKDLRTVVIVTPRQTTKHDNMTANPNVSFLISTARNDPADPAAAVALTVTAFATELDGERRHVAVSLFAEKHPELLAFASAPTSAVMELKIDSYQLVCNFQGVTHIRVH